VYQLQFVMDQGMKIKVLKKRKNVRFESDKTNLRVKVLKRNYARSLRVALRKMNEDQALHEEQRRERLRKESMEIDFGSIMSFVNNLMIERKQARQGSKDHNDYPFKKKDK